MLAHKVFIGGDLFLRLLLFLRRWFLLHGRRGDGQRQVRGNEGGCSYEKVSSWCLHGFFSLLCRLLVRRRIFRRLVSGRTDTHEQYSSPGVVSVNWREELRVAVKSDLAA